MPAPVRSRRAFTSLALISIVLTGSLPAPPRFLAAAESAPPLEAPALWPVDLGTADLSTVDPQVQAQPAPAAPAAAAAVGPRALGPAHAPSRPPRAASLPV